MFLMVLPSVGVGLVTASADGIPQRYRKVIARQLERIERGVKEGPYRPDWEDLKRHQEAPEWFRDAKFGIYFHWGVYTVPAYGNEWYPKWMHVKPGGEQRSYYEYHVTHYGEPSEFGYHDFVPMFKAEHFDAEEWADLFVQAGARFAGPVAEHHDGFAMWASELTPWNVGSKGPRRDTTGELERAIRQRGLKFITTFHHERTRTWYPRVPGWPTTSTDPELRMLYANLSEELFNQIFLAKLGEVIDQYRPDLIWFDGRLEEIQEPYHLRFLAYYFNSAAKWGREVVVTTKGHDYPPEIAVEDIERGRLNHLADFPWLTDDSIARGSWCYTQNLHLRTTQEIVHELIDIVSKNGCLLFNIAPRSDGVIPQEQREILLGIGKWLRVNGEALYATRPWLAFGEGPQRVVGKGRTLRDVAYTWQDVRYTRSKDGKTVYAIVLGWPQAKEITLTATRVEAETNSCVTLLGYEGAIRYRLNGERQLVIEIPPLAEGQLPCKYAYAFKLAGFRLALHPSAR